ncbi:hypothetical protein LTR17_027280 [Elasticomyces elasticus]|nr:hypothetical protein LTR17_027280 [Elasticomyces elasticus]
MSIFKRKPKADKVEKAEKGAEKGKKGSKESKEDAKKQLGPEKPPQQPYKPTHAASDAVRKAPAANAGKLSQDAADYAHGGANLHQQPVASTAQPFSHAGMRPVVTGTNPQPPYRGFSGGFNMQRNNSAEVFTTDPDAPPMPTSSSIEHGSTTPRNGPARQTSEYFSQRRENAPGFDRPMLGNPKMAMAARDRGYINPHTSSDSGYASTAHSRAPSEQMNAYELSKPHLPRDSSGFLPELSLSEELARDPAFSEASFGADEADEQHATTPKQPDSALKNGKGYFSRLDPSNDSKKVKSSGSRRTTQKQTRFEQAPEVTAPASPEYSRSMQLPEAVHEVRPESATLPHQKLFSPTQNATPYSAPTEEPRPSFSVPVRHSTPPPQRHNEPHPQFAVPARMSTPPPAREQEQPAPPMRFSSSPPQHQQAPVFQPLERIISPSLRSSQPPVGSLDGFKVNKRGKILDEEGEIIGELIEGDIIDCVRQRCNGYGEVLDDHGRVVGRVQPMEQMLDSPIMRVASPGPSPAPVVPQQNYFVPQVQQPPPRSNTPSGTKPNRRESAASQREVFTPAWQRQSQNNQASMAWELRDHLANTNTQAKQAIAPAEYPGNVTAVELDASGAQSESEEEEEEEVTPIFDYSEVFMPVPSVPPRSARRSETPSPPVERRWAASELIQPISETNKRAVQEDSLTPSRHVSAPPAARQPPVQQQAPIQMPSAAPTLVTVSQTDMTPTPDRQQPVTQYRPSQPLILQPSTSALGSMIARATSPAPQVHSEPERHSTVTPTTEQQLQNRRALLRAASDSNMSDMSKSYAKPAMSPVPEDGDAPDDAISQQRSPALFSYKGAIPASDGPPSNASLAPSRALGAKSPPLPTFTRQAFVPMNSAQFSSAGGPNPARGTPPRQFTTSVPGPRTIPGLQQKGSFNAPLKRSPLSSHEITPPDSDQGSTDGEKTIGVASGMHSRQPSLRSMRSMQSTATNGKPRSYFTHGGRVAVSEDENLPSQAAAESQPAKEAAPSISGAGSISGKKSRFSLGFGRKGRTVAAH